MPSDPVAARRTGNHPGERWISSLRLIPTDEATIRSPNDRAARSEMNSRSTQTTVKTATGWVVALTAIGSLMAALDTLVVSTSLSTIRLDLGASIEDLEWTVNAYNLSFAVLLITAAAVGDRYGRRKLYAGGLALFAAAAAASALSPSACLLRPARPWSRRWVWRSSVRRSHPSAEVPRSASSARSPGLRLRPARSSAARSPR